MFIIIITIVKLAILVNILPYGLLIKPAIIRMAPADNSDIATKLARNGDKSKYSINPSGGSGNLFSPCIIKAIPIPNLNRWLAKDSKFNSESLSFLKKLSIVLF